MQIELTQEELETINAALECWEKESNSDMLIGEMLHAMLIPQKDQERAKAESDKRVEIAKKKGECRKLKSLLLRAKLAQAVTQMMIGEK
jgi:hypothetical protein